MSTIRANTITDAAGTGAPTLTNGAVLPAGSAAAPAISPTGDSNTGLFFPAADTIAFTKGGVEAMRINSSGNVGIGTTSPTASLDVLTQVTGALGISLRGRSSDNVSDFSLKSNDAATVYGQIQGRSTDLRLQTGTALPITFFTNSAERMRIDASGNVGIGTSSPNAASIVDAQSTTKGVRFPNMTTAQKTAIANVAGNVVFDTTLGKLCVNTGSAWQTITSV